MSLLNFDGYGGFLVNGVVTTASLTIAAAVLGSFIGLAMATARLSPWRFLQKLSEIYSTVIRGVPDLLVIFLIYYGGSASISALIGHPVEISGFMAGTFALGVVFGAYTTEIFRGAINEVPRGQMEGALALGLSTFSSYRKVIIPQACKLALPAFSNQLNVLLKETALVSLVGLEDLMRKANIAVEATNQPFLFYAVTALIYLTLSLSCEGALNIIIRRTNNAYQRG